jgi:hypothetical protein
MDENWGCDMLGWIGRFGAVWIALKGLCVTTVRTLMLKLLNKGQHPFTAGTKFQEDSSVIF